MTERMVVSAAQFESAPRQAPRNLQAACEGIATARELGAALVVLPEYCLSGYDREWISRGAPGGGSELGGGPLARAAATAGDLGISVVLNDLERHEGRLFSTSFIITGGRVVGLHRKTILTEREALAGLAEGDTAAVPVSLLGMTVPVAPMICFEHGFPEIAMDLALAGAGVIAISSAIQDGTQYLRNLRTRARAQDNGCYVIAANSVGGGYCGESMIVDPRGDVMVRASATGPDVIVAELDADLIEAARKAEPVLRLRRPELRQKASLARSARDPDAPGVR